MKYTNLQQNFVSGDERKAESKAKAKASDLPLFPYNSNQVGKWEIPEGRVSSASISFLKA